MTQLPWATYSDMVEALLARSDNEADLLMHAAIGVAGEICELIDSPTYQNKQEELGDVEFYLEAFELWKRRYVNNVQVVVYQELDESKLSHVSTSELQWRLFLQSMTLIDLAKKVWAYKQAPKTAIVYETLETVRAFLDELYRRFNVSVQNVKEQNMHKLARRYPTGAFTTIHSDVRLDKKEEGNGQA